MINYTLPPAADELEVSIFSRGFGECIVMRSTGGEWIVIDSLINSEKEPIALRYLTDLGVNPEEVALVVATHWHDDHIKGMARVVDAFKNARFAYSTVLCRDEFKAAIQKCRPIAGERTTNGVSELNEIGNLLKAEPQRRILATANQILFERGALRIEALSPSHDDVQKFLEEIQDWIVSDIHRVAAKPRRNDTSVVVVAHVSDELFLYGADLEVRGKLSGWQGVHELAWAGRGQSLFFKVPHHGSITGHYDPAWDDLMIAQPMTAVTPFNRGSKKLPSKDDVDRILSRTPHCYQAGSLEIFKRRQSSRIVDKTINEASIRVWRLDGQLGQVRMRRKVSQDWNIELFGRATKL